MAKISLTRSIKFRLLVKELGIPKPHVLGHLEYLWQTAHEAFSPVLATAEIVELAAEWEGTPNTFCDALEKVGFLDRDQDNQLVIHDYWEHCPEYVRKRALRAAKDREEAYIIEQSGQRQTTADNGRQSPPKSENVCLPRQAKASQGKPSQGQPTPLPPAPAPVVGPPIASAMAETAELERRFIRYTQDPNADQDDKATLRAVLTHVTSDRLTHKPYPVKQRLKILDEFAGFETEVVYRACHHFARDGCIESGKDHRYLLGICRNSATSETIEERNEARKRERNELRQSQEARGNREVETISQTIGNVMRDVRRGA